MIHGMLFRAQTAVVWRELPERYGRWKTDNDRILR